MLLSTIQQICRAGILCSFLCLVFLNFIFITFLILLFSPLFSSLLPSSEKRSRGLFHQITKTHGTVIGVSSGIVLVLLIISILVQMKQPRKKVTCALWLAFCSAEKQTKPVKKIHVIKSNCGFPDQMGTHASVRNREEENPLS